MKVNLPPFDQIVSLESESEQVGKYVQHNVQLWKWIRGAFGMLKDETLPFDPVKDYWDRTDRRIVTGYLHKRLRESYWRASEVRALALHLFRHFETQATTGPLRNVQPVREETWPDYRPLFAAAAQGLGEPPEYGRLKETWKRLKGPTLQDDFLAFLASIESDSAPNDFEPAFFHRMQWLPYSALMAHGSELFRCQRFFFAFYTLFASTNAFAQGGGLVFAPILQNNPSQTLLDHARKWADGERPDRAGFRVATKWEEKDCSHYVPVLELYGFLNLDRHPFHNGVTAESYEALAGTSASPIDALENIGQRAGAFLDAHPDLVNTLSVRFRKRVEEATDSPWMVMEGVTGPKAVVKAAEGESRADDRLRAELTEKALGTAKSWNDRQAAAALLHLAIDSFIYNQTKLPPPPPPPPPDPKKKPPVKRIHAPLADSLRLVAKDALGFLRDGHHVLLAGAPGTGKTTVAQWVAHVWNEGLSDIPFDGVAELTAPTTVANSSWSPFHTIGGLVAALKGGYTVRKGIFISPVEVADGKWRLRSECIVLDEMNRADLDRCIGELYPLLTRSVERVTPAGIPDVESIELDEKFRIVATVNDASIDDIVFPISEGLARRFVRIELPGARIEDVRSFVTETPGALSERATAAIKALELLFLLATDEGFKFEGEDAEFFRIPLGVGYFDPLRSWVGGGQALAAYAEDGSEPYQARKLISLCLGPARRNPRVRKIQRRLLDPVELA